MDINPKMSYFLKLEIILSTRIGSETLPPFDIVYDLLIQNKGHSGISPQKSKSMRDKD